MIFFNDLLQFLKDFNFVRLEYNSKSGILAYDHKGEAFEESEFTDGSKTRIAFYILENKLADNNIPNFTLSL